MSGGNARVRQAWQRKAILAVAAAGGYVATTLPAYGTVYSWTPTSGNNWSTAANWTPAGPPPQNPTPPDVTDLVFGGNVTVSQTSTQNIGTIAVNSMTFNGTYTGAATLQISGSSTGDQFIHLGAGGIVGNVNGSSGNAGTVSITAGTNRKIILTAPQTWSNTNTFGIISVRREIEGAFKITKTGAGTIELQGANTLWTGGLDLNEGFIRLSANGTAVGAGPVNVITDNNVGFSASGTAPQPDQTFTGLLTFGGAGSVSMGGSFNYFLNNVNMLNDKTISVSRNVTVNGSISGPGIWNKTGGMTLTLNAANSNGGFIAGNGVLAFGNDNQLGAAGAALGVNGGSLMPSASITSSRNINVGTNGGFFDAGVSNHTFGNVDGAGSFTKLGAGDLLVNRVRTTQLAVNTGAVKIAAGVAVGEPARVSNVTALNLAGGATPTATLDLTNNGLVVDYAPAPEAEPFDTIKAQVINAYGGGTWANPGITSSLANSSTHGVGFGEASALFTSFPATFMGQEVDDTAVLVRYTRYGDANLDGTVNLADFNRLATNFGQSGKNWTDGDFTYDGTVNLSDFNRLAGNFGLAAIDHEPTPQDWSNLSAAVPEPSSLLLSGVPALAGMRMRRRRATR
jgi:autotransporter-associated beta strand protein